MKRHPAYTLHVLEHIGLPLIVATARAETPRAEEIEKVRDMLDRTVQCAQELEKIMELPASGRGKLPLKLELAAISSKIIASQFENEKQIPEEKDLKRIVQLTETILLFSDGYESLLIENRSIDTTASLSSSTDCPHHLSLLISFAPAINAIAEFSYGQTENKLIQSVSETLKLRAKEMYARLIGESDPENEIAELSILRTLVGLYADTHMAETKKMMRMDERIRMENSSQITIDIVWRAFDKKYAMLEALIEGLVPVETKQSQNTLQEEENPLEGFETKQEAKESPLSFFTKSKN